MSGDMCLPQFAQAVEQRYRVRAGIEQVAVRFEDDFKCRPNLRPRFRFLAWQRGRILRRQQSRERSRQGGLSWIGLFLLSLKEQPNDVAGVESAVDQFRRDRQTPFPCQVTLGGGARGFFGGGSDLLAGFAGLFET